MYKCRMTPYEGQEPYIFISYAHKDSDEVLPILDTLSGLGYRVWYDDGIAPGSEWPEYIATHLAGAGIVLAFVSPNSIASANCRREVTFALSRNKPFIGIYLRETEMSPGMEMQLSAQQCILKYAMAEEAFLTKLCAVNDMALCLGVKTEPAPASERPAPAENGITDADMAAVGVMTNAVQNPPASPKEEARAAKEAKRREIKAAKAAADGAKPKKKAGKKLLIIPAAVLVIAIAVVAVVLSRRVTICGETYTVGDSYLRLNGVTVTDADISAINRLKDLYSLTLTDCEITGDLSALSVPGLETLNAENCTGMNDFSFLAGAQELGYLVLENCSVTDSTFPNLSEMTGMRSINLSGNPDFSDIAALPAEHLTILDVSGTNVSDFAPIAAMTNLTTLDISNTAIENPTDTIMSLKLNELRMDNVPVTDYAFADALTLLNTLSVCNCGDGDDTIVSVLEKNAGTLTTILMDGNSFSYGGAGAAQALEKCTLTETLSLNNSPSPIDDLEFVSGMSSLKYFSAVNSWVSDISPLNSCTALTEVHLDNNSIEDLDLTALTNLTYLTLDGNSISDLSGLPDNSYNALTLLGDPIDLSALALTQGGRSLVLDYPDGLENDVSVLSNWYYVYIVGCPLDKQVTLEDAAGLETNFVDEAGAQDAEESIAASGNTVFVVPHISIG